VSASPTRPAAPAAPRGDCGDSGFDPGAVDRIVLPELPVSYRPKDAAATTKLSRPLIALAIKRGDLAAVKLGGCVLIPREALQAWLDRYARPVDVK
jgi:excisionase family DNA binding protein